MKKSWLDLVRLMAQYLLDQTPAFDPTEAEPVPDFVFDQSLPDEFDD